MRPEKARRAKSKVKTILIIFFDIKGIVHKEFLLAGQAVNSAYYCDVLLRLRENVRRFRPELWLQFSHFRFHQGIFFYQKQHDCSPHPPYFSVSSTEDKTERPPFSHS
jgi:hypothetical protein